MQRPDEKHLERKKEKGGKVNSSLIKWRPADMKKYDEPEIAKWRLGKNNKLTPCRMHARQAPGRMRGRVDAAHRSKRRRLVFVCSPPFKRLP